MLILSRSKGEAIIIDHNIKVSLLNSNKKRALIGVEAPSSVDISRAEIYQSKEKLSEDNNTNNQ